MPDTIVIDLDVHETTVRLRDAGFESSVRALSCVDERPLSHFYRRAARANTTAFGDHLLGLCLDPRRPPTEIAALSEPDRAHLRRAVVAVCGKKALARWRALYGSHLSADERLFGVMLWRWRESERVRATIRRRHRELASMQEEAEATVRRLEARFGGASAGDALARTLGTVTAGPSAQLAKLYSSQPVFEAAKLLGNQPVFEAAKFLRHQPLFDAAKLLGESRFGVAQFLRDTGTLLPDSVAVVASSARWMANPASVTTLDITKMASVAHAAALAQEAVERWSRLVSPAWEVAVPGRLSSVAVGVPTISALIGGPFPDTVFSRLAAVSGAMEAIRRWEQTVAAAQIGPVFRSRLPDFSPLASEIGGSIRRYIEPFGGEMLEAVQVVERFERRWQQRALSYLVSLFLTVCDIWQARRLASLDDAAVEEAVLYALEDVVRDGEFVPEVRAQVARAPHLNDSQRVHLDHMLEHAAEGKWVYASAPLYVGLEGAFWEVAYVQAVVTTQRKRIENPNKDVGFESMVKLLGLDQEFQTFVVRGLYGTTGNSYRHGGADSGERRQVLLGIAALTGWLEKFAGARALDVLAERMAWALPAAIARARLLPSTGMPTSSRNIRRELHGFT